MYHIDSYLLPEHTEERYKYSIWHQRALKKLKSISPGLLVLDSALPVGPLLSERDAKGNLLRNPGVPFILGLGKGRTTDYFIVAGDIDFRDDHNQHRDFQGEGVSWPVANYVQKAFTIYTDRIIPNKKLRDDPTLLEGPGLIAQAIKRTIKFPNKDLRMRNLIMAAKLHDAHAQLGDSAPTGPNAALVGRSHRDNANIWNDPKVISGELKKIFCSILQELKVPSNLHPSLDREEVIKALCYRFGSTTLWRVAPAPDSMEGKDPADQITKAEDFVSPTIRTAIEQAVSETLRK